MALAISCPNCGKQFRNIKSEMAGRKARCSCGTIVRLGPKKLPASNQSLQNSASENQPDDLLAVDLLGDERLGDQLLGGDLSQNQTARRDPASSAVVEVPVVVLPPLGLAHPKPARVKHRKAKPKSHGTSPSGNQAKRPSAIDDAYGDLDEILRGQGDPAPLTVRPQSVTPATAENPVPGPGGEPPLRLSNLGFLAALGSATLAFWFGLVIFVSRFQIVDFALLSHFCETLQSVYLAVFGLAEVPRSFQLVFIALGWAFWIVGTALVLFGVMQFANAFFRVLSGRSLIGWSDGMTAAMGVCAVFLMVAMLFAHVSFTKQQNRLLDEYEKPTVLDRGPIGNVELLRAEIDEDGKTFQTTMLVASAIPMSIFVLSMVRLFLKTPEPDR